MNQRTYADVVQKERSDNKQSVTLKVINCRKKRISWRQAEMQMQQLPKISEKMRPWMWGHTNDDQSTRAVENQMRIIDAELEADNNNECEESSLSPITSSMSSQNDSLSSSGDDELQAEIGIAKEQIELAAEKLVPNEESLSAMAQVFCFGQLDNPDFHSVLMGMYCSTRRRMTYTARLDHENLMSTLETGASAPKSSPTIYEPTVPNATATVLSSVAPAIIPSTTLDAPFPNNTDEKAWRTINR